MRGLGCADAVRAVFAAYPASHGKPRYADETPHYVSHLPPLAARFPEARFVHLVRDRRDVALSLLEVSWGADTIEAARHWRRHVLDGRGAGLLRDWRAQVAPADAASFERSVGDPLEAFAY